MTTINTVNTGLKFYGMNEVEYTISTDPGVVGPMDYETLIRKIAIERSVKLDNEVLQVSNAVKTRQKIVETLGNAMAFVNMVSTDLNKESSVDKQHEYTISVNPPDAHAVAFEAYQDVEKYTGVAMHYEFKSYTEGRYTVKIKKSDVMTDQNNLEYVLDMQNNLLQQDMIGLQSLLSKQSNAFESASKLTKKVSSTRGNTINGMA